MDGYIYNFVLDSDHDIPSIELWHEEEFAEDTIHKMGVEALFHAYQSIKPMNDWVWVGLEQAFTSYLVEQYGFQQPEYASDTMLWREKEMMQASYGNKEVYDRLMELARDKSVDMVATFKGEIVAIIYRGGKNNPPWYAAGFADPEHPDRTNPVYIGDNRMKWLSAR